MSSANIKVTASVLSVDIDKPKTVIPQADYGSVEVDIQGLGETNYPEPRQFKYTDDEYSIVDSGLKFNIKPNIYDTKTTNTIISFRQVKPLTDVFTKLDTIQLLNNYVRLYTDSYTKTDLIKLYSIKDLRDYFSYLDQIITKTEFKRAFNDYVYSTDDVLGDLNTDDDQYAIIGKGIVNQYLTSDSVTLENIYLRSYTDYFSNIDTVALDIHNEYNDTSLLSDAYNIDTSKTSIDYASIADHPIEKILNVTFIESDYFLEDFTSPDYESGSVSAQEYLSISLNTNLFTTSTKVDTTHIGLQNYSYGNYVESGYVGIQQIV